MEVPASSPQGKTYFDTGGTEKFKSWVYLGLVLVMYDMGQMWPKSHKLVLTWIMVSGMRARHGRKAPREMQVWLMSGRYVLEFHSL